MAERSSGAEHRERNRWSPTTTSISPHETMWRMYGPKGHRTILPFAEGAEIPDEWECRCGSVAHREGDADREGDEISKPTRTHWDMLLERRSEEELATLLEKRLQMHRDGWIPDYECLLLNNT